MLPPTLSWHPQWSTSSWNERVCWAEATEHVNENPSADLQEHIFGWKQTDRHRKANHQMPAILQWIFFGKWEERKVWLKAKKRGRSGEFWPYELDDVTVLKQKESKPYFCRLMSFRISLYQSFVSCSDNFPAKSHVLYYFLGLLAVNESILFPNSLILIIELLIDWLEER